MDFRESLLEHVELARRLRYLRIHFDAAHCVGDWTCYEVCPVGCWMPDRERGKAVFHNARQCIACGACVLQCPGEAIELR
jgi:NAD-dependent dihydropyrimidine dehydrogenase PreA subunit